MLCFYHDKNKAMTQGELSSEDLMCNTVTTANSIVCVLQIC